MRWALAAIALVAVLTGCSPAPPAHSSAPASPTPSVSSRFTSLASPLAAPPALCSLDDLTEQSPTTAGVTGNLAVVLIFVNHSGHACSTGGFPTVAVSQPGQVTIMATPGGFWQVPLSPATSTLAPGATAHLDVGFSLACATSANPPLYEHLTVTLAGGGTFHQTLSGRQPADSQVLLGVIVVCGVTVTQLTPTA